MPLLTRLAEEAPAHLIMPNWAFALIAAGVFVVLGFVSWSYRDVANRHADKAPFGGGQEHENLDSGERPGGHH